MKELINHTIEVLDHGFIRLVDYMGSDADIASRARVSYAKGTKSVSDDISLIRRLMRKRHTSPFEMAEMVFHVKVPIDTIRQWDRHRTASKNEISARYSEMEMEFERPNEWRLQSKINNQGSEGTLSDSIALSVHDADNHLLGKIEETYKSKLQLGIAREQARKMLPMATYTEMIWKCDLHNILHFLELRMHKDAQKEIREYAEVVAYFVKQLFPYTWEAFSNYRLNSITLSEYEIIALRSILKHNADYEGLSKSEIGEFHEKLRIIGLE